MGKSRPPKVHRYSMHFKATAVRLSELPDILIQVSPRHWTFIPSCCHDGANKRGRD